MVPRLDMCRSILSSSRITLNVAQLLIQPTKQGKKKSSSGAGCGAVFVDKI